MIAVTVQMSGEDMSLVLTHAKSCINNTMLKELNLKKKLWKDIRSEQASTDMASAFCIAIAYLILSSTVS